MEGDPPVTAPETPTPTPSPPPKDQAPEPTDRKPGQPNKPLDQVVAEIKALRAADANITKTKLVAKIGVSHGYIDKALNAIEEEEGKAKAAAAAAAVANPPAETPPKEADRPEAAKPDMGVKTTELVVAGFKPEDIKTLKEATEAIEKFGPEVGAVVLAAVKTSLAQATSGKSPLLDAIKSVDQVTRDRIVAEAILKVERSLAAGGAVWAAWEAHGLDTVFETPAEMVETTVSFWWNNKDRYWDLVDELEQVKAELVGLYNAFGPQTVRRQMYEAMSDRLFDVALHGHSISPMVVMILLAEIDNVVENRKVDYLEEARKMLRLEVS